MDKKNKISLTLAIIGIIIVQLMINNMLDAYANINSFVAGFMSGAALGLIGALYIVYCIIKKEEVKNGK